MGYSKSQEAVEKVKNFLEDMLMAPPGEPITWHYAPSEHLAYIIREGLYAARYHGITRYSLLNAKFRLTAIPGKLVAIPRKQQIIATKEPIKRVIEDLTESTQIVSTVINNPGVDEFLFAAIISSAGYNDLYKWVETKGWKLIFTGDGLILTKKDPYDIAWRPE
jgi:hypothetical protein